MNLLNPDIFNAQNNETYPQVFHMGYDYDFDAADSVTKMASGVPLAVRPNLRSFHLKPETNLTDVISQTYTYAYGLLVSEAFRSALAPFAVQPHVAYPAEVVHRGTSYDYHWLHVTEKVEPRADFGRSEFLELPRGGGPPSPVKFAGAEDMQAKCARLVHTMGGEVTARRLAFPPGTPALDLFFFQLTTRLIFVSDPLAERLRRDRLTGFDLSPSAAEVAFG